MSETSRRVIFHMLPCGGLIAKLGEYAEIKNMDRDAVIDSLIDDWENGEKGLIRSIEEGDFENFLDVELAAHDIN